MKAIMLSLLLIMCLAGFSSLPFADEIGKMKGEMMKGEMKGHKDMMKDEMMGKMDAMKGENGAMERKLKPNTMR